MKRIAANITLLALAVLLFTTAGYSQYAQLLLTVDVPFAFNVGNKTFPAGEYRIVRIAPHTLALRDAKERFLTSVVTGTVQTRTAHATPKLRFELEEGRYVLSEVWPSGVATGYQLSAPKRLTTFAQQRPAGTEVQASASGK